MEIGVVFAAYGLRLVHSYLAADPSGAAAIAASVGFPVALKICCLDITHKSDVGGIALNLEYTYRVRQEAIAMLVEGPVFGAPVAFGQGGASIDIQHDSSLELAPLNTLLARRLIARTRVSRLLRVYRGEGAPNIETVVELLIRLGLLAAADHPEIRQLEINSLLVDADGTRALDARLRIAPAQSTEG
ncbi:MAG TPA: acetate--CoA ligase family protein [Stellaceae bacterium]|jgi:acetyltransferase|nr:acetate--CoA ligase family protein [Stellaceae bacterium]